ncbi:MAG: hypothetical protein KAR42_17925 [candidate division Zixibacteria bacterium]|nr:hypothetical protein [candidate division Zixibacteria bacterium]
MKLKQGDIIEIYHPKLEAQTLYVIIKEDGKLKGARYPNRMAQDGNIKWLKENGKIIGNIHNPTTSPPTAQ